MANAFMNALNNDANFIRTENGAVARASSGNALLDMFAFGGAYRTRSDADCILLFKNALDENPLYAIRCLFYLRDVRGGQGERRFFRVCMKWLATERPAVAMKYFSLIPDYGRYDDLYIFVGTPLEKMVFSFIKNQLAIDIQSKTPSLLAKWLKSEQASSAESRRLAAITRKHFNFTNRQYRKVLSELRERIRVVERLMSENRWDEIEFDKIPSKAGLIYKNAFARRDVLKERYRAFATSKTTKVNAETLYPYEVVSEAFNLTRKNTTWRDQMSNIPLDNVERLMINKYWDNLKQYFDESSLDALCVIDTSASMWGPEASAPMNVAISLGLYAADKARGPFAGHYVSFSSRPQLIKTEGVDFVDKVERIYRTNLCENTNIEATFDMLLNTAISNHCKQKDLPKSIVIISDLEFDRSQYYQYDNSKTLMENIAKKWEAYGYTMPNLVFWCVQSRQNNVPMMVKDGVSLVSGFSPVLFEQIMKGKTAFDIMMDKLNSNRYSCIR